MATGDEDVARLLADLARWTANARTEEGAGSRRKQTWLRHQAAEDTSLSMLALAWAERAAPVRLTTVDGNDHRGRMVATGRDFVLLLPGIGEPRGDEPRGGSRVPGGTAVRAVLVATSAIAFVRQGAMGREGPGAPDGRGSGSRDTGPLRHSTTPALTDRAHELPPRLDDGSAAPALVDLAGVLAGLAPARPRVRMVARSGGAVAGELRWVGSDVACLALDTQPPHPAYVALSNVSEVSVLAP